MWTVCHTVPWLGQKASGSPDSSSLHLLHEISVYNITSLVTRWPPGNCCYPPVGSIIVSGPFVLPHEVGWTSTDPSRWSCCRVWSAVVQCPCARMCHHHGGTVMMTQYNTGGNIPHTKMHCVKEWVHPCLWHSLQLLVGGDTRPPHSGCTQLAMHTTVITQSHNQMC